MDPAVAALSGAALGALSTLLVGVIAPAVRDAAARRRDRHTELRREINAFIDSLAAYLLAESNGGGTSSTALGIQAESAANHIAMGLPRSETPIADMLFDSISVQLPLAEKVARADACIDTLREWYRGEISTRRVHQRYSSHLTANLASAQEPRG